MIAADGAPRVRITVEIEDLAPGGEGLGRAGDRPVFVPFAGPGDVVEAEATAGPGPLHATPLRLLRPGPGRIEPPCPHFGPWGRGDACGGCEWQHVPSGRQLEAKARALRESLRRIGRLEPGTYRELPPLASPSPYRYRSRAKLHLDRAGGALAYFRRRSHEPVRPESCALLAPGLDALRAAMAPALARVGLAPREVALEWSDREGRGSALLVFREIGPGVRARADALLAALPALAGVVLGAEGAPPVVVGEPVLHHDRVPGRPEAGLQLSRPDVFQQANRGANALLVEAALALLEPEGEDVLELFCGSGNFTGPLADLARTVSAVEAQGPALDLARAELAGARGVRFFAGDALALARAFAREGRRFGAALLDPPREGAKGIGPVLRDLGVRRAVYVSCDPATLARDLRGCVEAGYRLDSIQAVDMFPQTHHVEGVACVVREDIHPQCPTSPARGED
ncbi:MAG TPA: TRAM domain-containing protein [Anaeromyxobacteraceae bacterium]|nr:TRAM domain-containing protein [Anaeromyxobacteraceae bacterium]